MAGYGKYRPEADARAAYDEARRDIRARSRGPVKWLALAVLWIGRHVTVRGAR